MNKQKIIDTINNIKNEPIAELKKNLVGNSSGTNFKGLMEYNAMLDNITIGIHTTTTIEFAGHEWKFRLLSAKELMTIKKEVIDIAKKEDWFDDINIHYHEMIKILTKALSPSPFKTDGKSIWNETDLEFINYDVLENLFKQYIHFNDIATRKPTEMPEDEINSMLEIVKKKQIPLTALDRKQLLIVANYYMHLSQTQAKMLSDVSSS